MLVQQYMLYVSRRCLHATNARQVLCDLWWTRADLGGHCVQVYVAPAPFAGHQSFRLQPLNVALDYWDYVRELAALVYYKMMGYI
jgi:hypothetical protein